MNQMFDAVQATALSGFGFRSVPRKDHVNSGELIRRRRVDGEEAVAAERAEIVQRALTGKSHDEIRGGDVALETDQLDAAVPESGEGKADLVDKGSVIAIERGLHALDGAGRGSPDRLFDRDGIGAQAQESVTLCARRHPISTEVL